MGGKTIAASELSIPVLAFFRDTLPELEGGNFCGEGNKDARIEEGPRDARKHHLERSAGGGFWRVENRAPKKRLRTTQRTPILLEM